MPSARRRFYFLNLKITVRFELRSFLFNIFLIFNIHSIFNILTSKPFNVGQKPELYNSWKVAYESMHDVLMNLLLDYCSRQKYRWSCAYHLLPLLPLLLSQPTPLSKYATHFWIKMAIAAFLLTTINNSIKLLFHFLKQTLFNLNCLTVSMSQVNEERLSIGCITNHFTTLAPSRSSTGSGTNFVTVFHTRCSPMTDSPLLP